MTRRFNKQQRKVLLIMSGGKCKICKTKLSNSFHADHIQPYARGGQTIIQNGQALCPQCNFEKGVKI